MSFNIHSLGKKPSWKKIVPICLLFLFGTSTASGALNNVAPYLNSILPSLKAASAPSLPTVGPAGSHEYFGIMTLDGTIGTVQTNYPSLKTYGSATQPPAPALDGYAQASSLTSVSLTTTKHNDVITAVCGEGATETSEPSYSVSGGSLTWYFLGEAWVSGSPSYAVFFAIASSPLTSASISCSATGAGGSEGTTVFGVSGANILHPLDPNFNAGAATAASSTTGPSSTLVLRGPTISTSNAYDFAVIAATQNNHVGTTYSLQTGTTQIGNKVAQAGVAYATSSSTYNNLQLGMNLETGNPYAVLDLVYEAPPPGSMDISLSEGLVATGGGGGYGLVNSTAVNFASSPKVLSFEQTAWSGNAYTILSPTYSTTSVGSSYLGFCICSGIATFFQNSSGVVTIIATSQQTIDYGAWAVTLGTGGTGISILLNQGNNFQMIYNNTSFSIGFDTGYEYTAALDGTASFAYLSTWNNNNPNAEGTFDQNVWYLVRHYELTGGNYSGNAVILDTSVPPLWANLTNGDLMYAGMAVEGSVINKLFGSQVTTCPNAKTCEVQQGIINNTIEASSVTPYSQTVTYLFCYATTNNFGPGACDSIYLLNADHGDSLPPWDIEYVTINMTSSETLPLVTYNVTARSCSGTCDGTISKMFLGGTSLNTSGTTIVQAPDGMPGMRFVSRHITSITGLLFDELGYTTVGNKLLNYVNAVVSNCNNQGPKQEGYYTCQSPYVEYYSPMFPTAVNSSNLSPTWYDTINAFPGQAFYKDMFDYPFATNYQIPNAGGYSQFSDPYVSRLAIPCAQLNFWLGMPVPYTYDPLNFCLDVGQGSSLISNFTGVQGDQGYAPTTEALIAEYMVNTGVTNQTKLMDQLDTVGWTTPFWNDTSGTLGGASDLTCAGRVPTGMGPPPTAWGNTSSIKNWKGVPYTGTALSLLHDLKYKCYLETAYPSYVTGAVLSAASAVASVTTGSNNAAATHMADEAASTLETILWSGNGSIAGDPTLQLMWQYMGGEDSSYKAPQAGGIGLQYSSNQEGFFGKVSSVLQSFGFDSVEPPESAGFEPVATEATGVSAVALLNFINYLPGSPSSAGPVTASSTGINYATTVTCSPAADCTYSTAQTGEVQFQTTSSTASLSANTYVPYTVTQPIPSAYAVADFALNGTITNSTNSQVTLALQLKDALNGETVFTQNLNIGPGSYNNSFYEVTLDTGTTIHAGTYLADMEVIADGTTNFNTTGGFVEPLGIDIIPNTLSDNFVSGPTDNNWVQFASAGCTIPNDTFFGSFNVTVSATGGTCEAGLVSRSNVDYRGGMTLLGSTTTNSTNSHATASIELSPEWTMESSNVLAPLPTPQIPTSLPDYLLLQSGGDGTTAKIIVRSNWGVPTTYPIYMPNQTISWTVEVSSLGNLLVLAQSGQNGVLTSDLVAIPSSVYNFNENGNGTTTTSLYAYLFSETNTTKPAESAFGAISIVGDNSLLLSNDLGQTMSYGSQYLNNTPQTGPAIDLTEFMGCVGTSCANSGGLTASSTNLFDSVRTISFTMMPFAVGGNNPSGGGSATALVSNGALQQTWYFWYYNNGTLLFGYTLGGTYYAISVHGVTTLNVPYFITGTWASGPGTLNLYINGVLEATQSGITGGPSYSAVTPSIGYANCISTQACYEGHFKGIISGLSMSEDLAANAKQVDQLMVAGAGMQGSQLGGGYWYPLTSGQYSDLFGVGPTFTEAGSGISSYAAISDFPYPWASAIWNPYLSPYETTPNSNNPYTVSVNSSYGNYAQESQSGTMQGPSFEVKEQSGLSNLANGSYAGMNLAPVDLSFYHPLTPLILSFDYRTTSNYASTDANNIYVKVTNIATGGTLFSQDYATTENGDSGWNTFSLDLANYVNQGESIQVFVGMMNFWSTDWNQNTYFTTPQISTPQQQPFSALSFYRYLPTAQNEPTYSFIANGSVQIPNYTPPSTSFTISMWFEPMDLAYGGAEGTIVANDATSGGHGFQVLYDDTGQQLLFDLGNGTGYDQVELTSYHLSNYNWYMMAMTWSLSDQLCGYLYSSAGTLLESGCTTGHSGDSMVTGRYPLSVGFNPGVDTIFFPGAVSDLRVSNYPASTAILQDLAKRPHE